jgi:hypothetical protein
MPNVPTRSRLSGNLERIPGAVSPAEGAPAKQVNAAGARGRTMPHAGRLAKGRGPLPSSGAKGNSNANEQTGDSAHSRRLGRTECAADGAERALAQTVTPPHCHALARPNESSERQTGEVVQRYHMPGHAPRDQSTSKPSRGGTRHQILRLVGRSHNRHVSRNE